MVHHDEKMAISFFSVDTMSARRQRPSRRAAEQRDELAPSHSIT
jgi:hypothetical protein